MQPPGEESELGLRGEAERESARSVGGAGSRARARQAGGGGFSEGRRGGGERRRHWWLSGKRQLLSTQITASERNGMVGSAQ